MALFPVYCWKRHAQEALFLFQGKKIYSNSMKTNRNELVRRLLSGVTKEELEFLVKKREEARRPIPTMRG